MKNKNGFYFEKQKSFLGFKYWITRGYNQPSYDPINDTVDSEFVIYYFKSENLAKEFIDDEIKGSKDTKDEKNEFICYYP